MIKILEECIGVNFHDFRLNGNCLGITSKVKDKQWKKNIDILNFKKLKMLLLQMIPQKKWKCNI